MSDKEKLQDPLKSLDQLYEPDERQKFFWGTLEDRHENLSKIILNDNVPIDVRQLFETAKNLSLYSWFVYRFHPVSELISFTALEMALRERYLSENPPKANSKSHHLNLYKLLQHAKDKKWIVNEKFQSIYRRAKHQAEYEKMLKMAEEHDFEKEPSMPIEEPNEEEIKSVMLGIDIVKAITENAHKIRNNLAHGSSNLNPNSITTLRTNAELINQIYPPIS